jgi:hypothetical protein
MGDFPIQFMNFPGMRKSFLLLRGLLERKEESVGEVKCVPLVSAPPADIQ